MRLQLLVLVVAAALGCSSPAVELDSGSIDSGAESFDAGADAGGDAGAAFDAGFDAGVRLDGGADGGSVDAGKEAACASTFGSALTNAYGRVDGIVTAIVPPGLMTCALPNSDHLVIQVAFADAGVHRMVVNVQSSFGDPRIKVLELQAPLPAPMFEEGWHPGLMLDYPTAFGVHSDAGWESLELLAASARVSDAIEIGAPIAVYATSSGGTFAASAHLIHRNGRNADGALVLRPTSSTPTWLLFSFANQTF